MTLQSLARLVEAHSGKPLDISRERLQNFDDFFSGKPHQFSELDSVAKVENEIALIATKLPNQYSACDAINVVFCNMKNIGCGVEKLHSESADSRISEEALSTFKSLFIQHTVHTSQCWINHGVWFDSADRFLSKTSEQLYKSGVLTNEDIDLLINSISTLEKTNPDELTTASDVAAKKFNAISAILENLNTRDKKESPKLSRDACQSLYELVFHGGPAEVRLISQMAEKWTLSEYIVNPLAGIANCCQILRNSGFEMPQELQDSMHELVVEILDYCIDGIRRDLAAFKKGEFSQHRMTQVVSIVRGFGIYAESLGDQLTKPLPFDDYPEVGEWMTWLARYPVVVFADYLPDAPKASVKLNKELITEEFEKLLKQSISSNNFELIADTLAMIGYASEAGVSFDSALVCNAFRTMAPSETVVATTGLELLLKNGLLSDDVCFEVLVTAPEIQRELLTYFLERTPERAMNLLRTREGDTSAFEFEEILETVQSIGQSQFLVEEQEIVDRINGSVLKDLSFFE